MKRVTLGLPAAVFLITAAAVSEVSAQGFTSILSKLGDLESRLASLETADVEQLQLRLSSLEASQQSRLTRLRDRVSTLEVTGGGSEATSLEPAMADLGDRLARLEEDLVGAEDHHSGEAEMVVAVASDLRGLVGELKSTLAAGAAAESALLASGVGVGISIETGIDAYSHYVWRGFLLADKLTVQPTATLGFGESGVALNIWASETVQDRDAPEGLEGADELDFTVSYDRSLGPEGTPVGLSVGYIRYTFPNMDGVNHSEEVYAGISLDNALAPSASVFYDYGLVDAFYLTAGIGPEFALDSAGRVSLSLGASAGFSDATRSFGFNDVTATASLGISGEWLTVSPTFGFTYTDDSVNADNTQTWAGVSISFNQ